MSETTPITRRASYGPSSPEIGSRGANTRTKIVEVSLELFGEFGFFNTSVDAIAKRAGISRATLYQYFPGKDEIFLELLNVCGRALFRVARRIGPLGPTKVGFDNLNWWLGEWSWVFDKYSTMFVQWTSVAATDTEVLPEINRFTEGYNQHIADRLADCDLHGLEPRAAATAIVALVHRINLLQYTDRVYGRDVETLIDSLSVFLQLFLFPDTPTEVINSLDLRVPPVAAIDIPDAPKTAGLSIEDRTASLTKRAANTVRKLVDAGSAQFAQRGYHRTSVDDVVDHAGVARGTFYKYFADKQDFLIAICIEGFHGIDVLAAQLSEIDISAPGNPELREWLSRVAQFMRQYAGSIDAWTEHRSDSTVVAELGARGQAVLDSAALADLNRHRRDYPFDPVVGAVIFRALVSRLPQATEELTPPLSEDETVTLMMACIARGFFAGGTQT
ncbi:TetR/AcrR family transcriptional regulator [Gordonia alkanivorans]|uniref:TetR/AcrR family transcriptional regulator n=1 Tax=Gordonia alkanivorans TaxID=84096 RepID=UPI00244A5AAA|nr:TetR/AcrR family transcriptional regulator [Gordonia alkanivorans]MDH3047273.1 TetR/AcrR family transcriptional regulator [Gordonia alkanivorans]